MPAAVDIFGVDLDGDRVATATVADLVLVLNILLSPGKKQERESDDVRIQLTYTRFTGQSDQSIGPISHQHSAERRSQK